MWMTDAMHEFNKDAPLHEHGVFLSIGMPVYNGEASIKKALNSLLAQTHRNFELIISDNASTDKTEIICRQYAEKDGRIRYIRQAENRGAIFNFSFVLQEASGNYFMWAAIDDWWHPEFIEANLRILIEKPGVVASISKVDMSCLRGKDPLLIGTYPIRGTYSAKLRQLFRCLGANSRFYALYRTKALEQSFVSASFMGGMDGGTLIRVLQYGDFYEVQTVLMERSCNGTSSKSIFQLLDFYGCRGLKRYFPMSDWTLWFFKNAGASVFFQCLDKVLFFHFFFLLIIVAESAGLRRRTSDNLS